jgi:hypothetical protein
MTEIEATADMVRLSYLRALLAGAGVECFVFDANSPWPGAVAQRLLVADADAELARHTIRTAESPER